MKMKSILFFSLLFFFTSCLTVSRIEKNCDKFVKICIANTLTETNYRDTTIYVDVLLYIDTTIYVPIPGYKDSVRIRDSLRIENGLAYLKSLHKQIGIIGVDVSVRKSQLSVDAYLTDSTILYNFQHTFNFQDSVKIYNAIKEKVTTNTVVLPPLKYIPKFYRFAFWLLIIELILLALFVYYKLGNCGVFGNLVKWLRFRK
jgi:hypothetical protein